MEKLGFEGLAVLLILLPGFLCAGIVQSLCVRPSQTELDKVWGALLYTFVVAVAYVAIIGAAMPVELQVTQDHGVESYSVQLHPKPLIGLMTIAVVLAFAIAGLITNDLTGKAFRKLRLTQRTSRSSVWSDTFHDYGGIVLVELADGRRVQGWVRYYSDEPSPASLFLEKAHWISEDNELIAVCGPGILITQELGIHTIEFLDWSIETEDADENAAAAATA